MWISSDRSVKFSLRTYVDASHSHFSGDEGTGSEESFGHSKARGRNGNTKQDKARPKPGRGRGRSDEKIARGETLSQMTMTPQRRRQTSQGPDNDRYGGGERSNSQHGRDWSLLESKPQGPVQHPVSPKAGRSKAHRKDASIPDPATTVDAVITAMLSDMGGPSHMIFPSLMEEKPAPLLVDNAKVKGNSCPGVAPYNEGRARHRVSRNDRLDHDMETNEVLELEEVEKRLSNDGGSTGTREIYGMMIQEASVKLPRDVHRAILDLFQVIILEPNHYPPSFELAVSMCVKVIAWEGTGNCIVPGCCAHFVGEFIE